MKNQLRPPCRNLYACFTNLKRYRISTHILMLAGLLGSSANAQLLHRYNFQTAGSANDTVGTVNGTIYGAATVSGGALNTTGVTGALSGGVPQNCVGLPAAAVAGITNTFSIETWYMVNYNGGFCTLFSFSDSTTANYVLATPARGSSPYQSDVSAIGGGGSTTEQLANGIYCDNGALHDMIVIYDGTNVTYYLDGALPSYSGLQNTFTDSGLVLSNLTYIGIGGGSPWPDNSIKGQTFDFRIYGQALTASQVATIHSLGTNASNAAIAAALAPPTAFTWDGGGANNNWSTGLNWIGGTAPATSGNSISFAGSTGTTPNLDANYSIAGLTFSNAASSFIIGTTDNSTLTLAGDVVNNSASLQTFNVPISASLAVALNAAAGNLTVNSNITLGAGSALTLTGNNNFTLNGNVSGGGSFTMNGPGTLAADGLSANSVSFKNGTTTISGSVTGAGNGVTYVGYTTGNSVVNMSGGTFSVGGEVQVGGSDISGTGPNGTGSFNVSSGTVNVGALTVCRGNNNQNTVSGNVTLNGGTTLTSTNDVILGFAGQGLGKVAISGSTFIIGPAAAKWFNVGFYDFTSAELDITNGNLLLENGSSIKMCRGGNTGGNVINQVGGAVTFYSDAGATVGGGGNLDLNYGGAPLSGSTYNLIGGTLTVPQIVASSSIGSGAFNFNGGTLMPTASTATFMQGLSAANVMVGGAYIDTTNFNVTIAQALLDGDGLGGGLTKLGGGTLSLTGGCSYSGPTVVEAGTLAVDATQPSSVNGLTVNNATLSLSLNNGSSSINAGNVIFTGNTTLDLNFGTATSPSSYAITANGATVSNTGTNTINVAGQNLVTGQYPLIYTGGSVPTNHFKLGPLPIGIVAVLTNSGSSLDLLITASGQNLTWYGADSLGNPLLTWNINTSSNWNSGSAKYLQYAGNSYGDNVTFDDSLYALSDANITLNTTVVPASVAFNNNSTPYSITGTGGIGGATAVTMAGGGVTYLGTTNTYSGGTSIGVGTLSVVNDSALGAATAPVSLAGGTLQFSNSTASARNIMVVSNSTIDLAANANVQLSGAISGAGALTKTDSGTLTVAGADNAAATLVGAGALNLMGGATNVSVTVGSAAGDSTMNISGSLVASNLFIGNVSGATAATYQTGGYLNINGGTGDNLNIGNWDGSFGYFSASGGSINVNGISIGGEEDPNVWPPAGGGDGIMEVKTVTINNSGWIVLARGSGPNTGVLNVYSGLLTYSGGGIGCNWNGNATSVTGTQTSIINIMGGSVTSTNQGVNFRTAGNTGIVNLNGGLLKGTSVTGSGTVNFNGGTLQAATGSGDFLDVVSANVYGGGGTIDDAGNAITIGQALLAPAGYGVNAISLTAGGSGYIAPPIVTISGGAGSNATAIATISGGVVTGIAVTSPGTGYGASDSLSVSFSGGGTSAVAPTVNTVSLTPNTSGGLTKIGNGTLTLNGVSTYTGPTTVNAGTLAGTGTIAGALTNSATLAPGVGGSGSLTVNGNIVLTTASTNSFAVNGTTPTNASVVAGANLTYGGVLNIVPAGAFTAGQQFQLFSGLGATNTSNFASIAGSPGSGLGFTFTNGVLSVVATSAINTNPPQVQVAMTGNILRLAWPANGGWILQSNSVGLTAASSWFNYPADGSVGVTNVNITVDPTRNTVFFRMVKP